MEKKILDKHFSPETGLIDKQKTVLTSGLTKFRRNDIQKLLNAQWWKKRTLSKKTSSKNLLDKISSKWYVKKKNFIKKNFFKKSSWIRGKQMWQICRLFFWQKKTVISPFNFGRTWKKTNNIFVKTMFCPQIFPLDTWKAVLLSWPKDFRKKTDKFLLNVRKWWRKNFRQTFFTRNWSNWQTENSTDKGSDNFSSKWQTNVDQCPMIK